MDERPSAPSDRTEQRRIEQYRDRWSSHGTNTGIMSISDRLSARELKEFEIFQEYDDKFLERISPDISVCVWGQDAVLFEEGSYLDLAFFVVDGSVFVTAGGVNPTNTLQAWALYVADQIKERIANLFD